MPRTLIILGLALLGLGLFWPVIQRLGLGHLPGDIAIERQNFRLYLPITTSVIVSLAVSLLFWLIYRK